jgi:F0F1-type ATP synthase delta subunit
MELDLSGLFTTKTEALSFSTRLSSISEKIYQTSFSLEKALTEEFGIEKKEKFMVLIRENKIHPDANSELKSFIDTIIEKIASLPVMTVTIAFEPPAKTLISFSQWFILNLNKQILFDIHVDPTLIAGAALTFQGKFTDLSIRPQFDQILTKVLAPPQSPPSPQLSTSQPPEHKPVNISIS